MNINSTLLQKSIKEFKDKNYIKSLELLREAKKMFPDLISIIDFNISLIHKRLQKQIPKVYIVTGLPRSGLTLLGALLNAHSKLNTWFFPYSSTPNSSNEPYKSLSDMQERFYEKYSIEHQDSAWVIVDSTAYEGATDWLKESIDNLRSSGEVDIKMIWIVRNPSQTYLSFVDASKKYWGHSDLEISSDHFKQYVQAIQRSLKDLYSLGHDNDFLFISYEKLVQAPDVVMKLLMQEIDLSYEASQLDYPQNFPSYKMAGDPNLCENPRPVFSESVYERKIQWEKHHHLVQELNQKNSEFFQELSDLDGMLLDRDILHKGEFNDDLVRKAFDEKFYLELYSDVKESNIDPLRHFLNYGWKEQRQHSRTADTASYSARYPNLSVNPIVHNHFISRFDDPSTLVQKIERLDILDPETYCITEDLVLTADKYDEPLVSIIIPAYNQENYTLACIETVIKHTKDVPYEIIVMDDASPNESARSIGKHLKNITFHSNEENQGFLKNCNKGVEFAKGKFILFLNNDTNVQPNWLRSLVELIESDDTIGMVGSRLVYPNGLQQEAGGIIWNDASGWNYGRLDDPGKPEYNYVKEVDYISGAAILLSRQLWDEIGGFDRRYSPAYYEDSDLAFEVRRHGFKVMYQPKSVVVHFEGISHGKDLSAGIKNYQIKNKEKFINKWKGELEVQFPNANDVFLARDRSRLSKHILIIDHYIPHYDKDAGSRTMWQYVLMMRELGFQVTFVGDNFFKHEPYTSQLESLGVEVLYGEYYHHNFESWLETNGKYFDSVYLLRPHIAIKYIDSVRKYTQAKVFYNGTDFHFLRMEREYEISKDERILESLAKTKADEFKLFERSDCVLTISDFERQFFEKKFPQWDVKLIPTFIYKENFPLSNNDSFKDREDILFVGGFSHGPNLEGVNWFLNKIWPKILKKAPDLKFYIAGSNVPEGLKKRASNSVIIKGFVTENELSELYETVKVVVAPLTFGAGVKGKIIESICHGVPTVTTSIGAEGIPKVSEVIAVENDEGKFAESVVSLCTDSRKWQVMRNKEIQYAIDYYSYESSKALVSSIF